MRDRLVALREEAARRVCEARTREELERLRVHYLGRKGALTALLRSMGSVPADERPAVGRVANQIKQELLSAFEEAERRLEGIERLGRPAAERTDVTLPGRALLRGTVHPITHITDEIIEIFLGMGFDVVEGPEVDLEYYNFEALNMPKGHPARDMQDTFYLSDEVLLRTHTSNVQIHMMKAKKPPLRIIAPGTVYRRDSDMTHSPMFHQVEGFLVDREVSFGELKGVVTAFLHALFSDQVPLRFRPSYFPFTEPSAEVDIGCFLCEGRGCRVCSHTGWLEVLGSGMIHPEVFRMVGYDPQTFTGFAFGCGIERIAMLKYGIDDIRAFFENDIRFLDQF